ncbi:hypothetical protein CTT39_02315 [Agrobacterium rosae]|nr:hypothetical protein CTT39_02315 [Agrobacterium rosae]
MICQQADKVWPEHHIHNFHMEMPRSCRLGRKWGKREQIARQIRKPRIFGTGISEYLVYTFNVKRALFGRKAPFANLCIAVD